MDIRAAPRGDDQRDDLDMIAPCRSLLFVPANAERRIARAHLRGAEAIILDLEDSVAPSAKASTRAGLRAAIAHLVAHHVPVLVRVNAGWRAVIADLDAAIVPGVAAVMLPKVVEAAAVAILSDMIGEFETERGMAAGAIGIVALIEHPMAIPSLPAIAAVPRVVALALGSEDFALALGVPPTPAILRLAVQAIVFAAAARYLGAIGLSCSLAQYSDPAAYGAAAVEARGLGISGALCIHPDQIGPVNAAFAPDTEALKDASAVIAAWDRAVALGLSVAEHHGRMIDRPVVERARRLLARGG